MQNETNVNTKLDVDSFVGCSKFIVNSYKNSPLMAKDYLCIYNGVDLEKFKPYWEAHSLRNDLRNRFGIGKDDFVALYVGRVSPEKGVEHFIEFFF